MISGRARNAAALAALLVLCAALFLRELGRMPLHDPDEPRYAGPGREMARGGDLLVPTLNGEPRLSKPILFYWLEAASFRVFGESEFSARLPSALAATATVLATAAFASRRYGPRAGLLSGALLALSPLFFALGRFAVTDMTVVLLTALAFYAFDAARRGSARALLGSAAALGLAAATKGPPAVLPVAIALCLALALARERLPLRTPLLAAGGGLFLLLALAWPLALRWRLGPEAWGEWVRSVLGRESAGRFLGGYAHPQPATFYVPVLLGGFFPWVLLLPGAIREALRRRREEERPASSVALLLWAGTTLVFFSVSRSKLAAYIAPAFPPLAVLAGAFLSRATEGGRRCLPWRLAGATAGVAFVAALLLAPLAGREAEREALLGSPWFLGCAVGVALFSGAAGILGRLPEALAGLALAFSSCVSAVADAAPVLFGSRHAGAEIGRIMARVAGPDGELVFVGNLMPGVAYYADRRVIEEKALEAALRRQPKRGPLVVAVGLRKFETAPAEVRGRFREVAVLRRGPKESTVILVAPPRPAGGS